MEILVSFYQQTELTSDPQNAEDVILVYRDCWWWREREPLLSLTFFCMFFAHVSLTSHVLNVVELQILLLAQLKQKLHLTYTQ